MRDVPLPVDLRQRLLTRLAEDRREWYTHLPRRHPRWAAAAAALLLLAVGFVVYAARRPPQRLELAPIAEKWNTQVSAPRDEVQRAFADWGYPVVLPPEFNYQYLIHYDLAEFEGRRVPHLQFLRGPNLASVYILSGSQFDVRAAVDQPREGSGRFTSELRPGPANSNLAY